MEMEHRDIGTYQLWKKCRGEVRERIERKEELKNHDKRRDVTGAGVLASLRPETPGCRSSPKDGVEVDGKAG